VLAASIDAANTFGVFCGTMALRPLPREDADGIGSDRAETHSSHLLASSARRL